MGTPAGAPRIRRTRWTLALIALLAVGQASRAEPAEGQWEAYAGTLPGVETLESCLLIRDGRTGKPHPWAIVSYHTDWTGPDGWGPMEAAATTDEHGLVRVRPVEGAPHCVVRAAGLGTEQRYGAGSHQGEVELWPAPEWHGRVVDVRGRPVVGAVVEWTSEESRHGPGLGRDITGPDGRWRMRFPEERSRVTLVSGPGVRQEFGIPAAPSWAAAPTFVALPGRDLEGRVIGRPEAVGLPRLLIASDTVRGPSGPIDIDGRFCVRSCEPVSSTVYLHGYVAPDSGPLPWLGDDSPELDPAEWTPGRWIVWDPEADPAAAPSQATHDLHVRVHPSDPPTEGAHLYAYLDRREDGRRHALSIALDAPDGLQSITRLPVGTYDLHSPALAPWAAQPASVSVTTGDPAPSLDVVVHRQPRLVIEPPLEGVEQAWVFAASRFGDEAEPLQEEHWARAKPFLAVPAEGEVGVTVAGVFGMATARAGPAEAGIRRVRFDLPRPAVVSVPEGSMDLDLNRLGATSLQPLRVTRADGRDEVSLPAGGRVWLDAVLSDEESGDDYAGCAIDVPAEPGARMELARAALLGPPRRELAITLPPGMRPPEPVVDIWTPHLVRADLDQPGVASVAAEITPDGDLHATSRALCDGASVRFDPEGWADRKPEVGPGRRPERWLPFRWRCDGEGPYRLRAPDGAITVRLGAPAGARAACLVDGDLFDLGTVPSGDRIEVKIRGVTGGEHTVIVAATACESRLLRLTLAEGEAREVEVTLAPRPSR